MWWRLPIWRSSSRASGSGPWTGRSIPTGWKQNSSRRRSRAAYRLLGSALSRPLGGAGKRRHEATGLVVPGLRPPALVARGWCRRCYDRQRHSVRFFGGYREQVLTRDRCCQVCGAGQRLVVHHRRPGTDRPGLQITLCVRCHVRLHRRRQLPGHYGELFFRLWREQHRGRPAQLRLPLTP